MKNRLKYMDDRMTNNFLNIERKIIALTVIQICEGDKKYPGPFKVSEGWSH